MTSAEAMHAARWWRRFSLTSSDPATCLFYAENQELLALDMDINPDYYRQKPEWLTEWRWYQNRIKGT